MADLRQFFSMNFIWAGNNAGYLFFTSITGWFAPEWVAGILRNGWLAYNGITGWIGTDFTSITTPEEEVDIYTPVANKIGITVPIPVNM